MRGLFGLVSLIVVLAIVGVLAMKQLRAVNGSVASSLPPAQSGSETPVVAPAASDVRSGSQQVQQRVADDAAKALEQGAAARRQEVDK